MKRMVFVVGMLVGVLGGVASAMDNEPNRRTREQVFYECMTDTCFPGWSDCVNNCTDGGGSHAECRDSCQPSGDACMAFCKFISGLP